ncbi:MAG: hypothetical protein ACM37W_16990 [Actinomycetota bacterium]
MKSRWGTALLMEFKSNPRSQVAIAGSPHHSPGPLFPLEINL